MSRLRAAALRLAARRGGRRPLRAGRASGGAKMAFVFPIPLDRLARSTWHLCQIAEVFARKRVHLHVLDQSIDTSDATGRLLFHMLGVIAQFETEIRAERQREGIQKAQERGYILVGRRS